MTLPYFQNQFAARIGGPQFGQGTEIYKFEKIKRAKRQSLADFPDRTLLDFGIGENDAMADPAVRHALTTEANKLENRGYADNGCGEFKTAAAHFMKSYYGVDVDSTTEINHCIGSKTALAILPMAFINPGDVALVTVPGYPVAATHTKYCGGTVFPLPLLAKNHFYPQLETVPQDVFGRAKILVLNYPNSPTGQVATIDFYQRVIEFAKQHRLVVIADAAHLPFQFYGKPLSFLSIPGAKDVGVEVHSMSKGWNMIGWRIGWVCGNPHIVRAFADIKDNCDSGQFLAIQKAAILALEKTEILEESRKKYKRRLQKLVNTLTEFGFPCRMPGGSYFLYTPAPQTAADGSRFTTAEEVSQFLIRKHSICTVPWDDAGPFLRFSVTYQAETEPAEDDLMAELARRLDEVGFEFGKGAADVA